MLTQGNDRKVMMEAVRIALDFSEQPALRQLIRQTVAVSSQSGDREIIDFIKLATASYWHQTGTCKMGTDETSVVDAELNVHGIEGLRVADASIMPKITGGNTHAPTLMIGEHLAKDLSAGSRSNAHQEQTITVNAYHGKVPNLANA